MGKLFALTICILALASIAYCGEPAPFTPGQPMAPTIVVGAAQDAQLDALNPLAPFAKFLGGALVTKILLWMGMFRALGKLVSTKLLQFQDAAIAWSKRSATTEDDHWLAGFLSHPLYAGASFVVDYFTSIKLRQWEDVKWTPFGGAPEKASPNAALAVAGCFAALLLVTGCGTNFQERREVYRSIADRATNAISSGRITNDVNTIRQLKK